MLIEPQYIPVVIVAWLIAIVSFIVPRLIKKKPVPANTNLGDIANAINSLQTAIYTAVYTAMGIEICVMLTAVALLLSKK